MCVMYNQVNENGCWQYTTNVNTFECIGNVSGTEKTPVIKAKEDLYDYSCDGKMKLSCFAKNARIRYVRFDTTGKYDKSLPLTNLTQNLLNPIFFVGIKSSNLTQKEDGSLEYNQVCNNGEKNTFSDKLGGYYPKPRSKCIRNDKNSQKKNRRVDKYSPKISCDTNTTTITAYKDQYVFIHKVYFKFVTNFLLYAGVDIVTPKTKRLRKLVRNVSKPNVVLAKLKLRNVIQKVY